MEYACRNCGVIHRGVRGKCGACGFTDKKAPGNEEWCKRIDNPEDSC